MIYNKTYIFGVRCISGIELLKLLDFLSEESNEGIFCYVTKVTFSEST